MSELQRLRNDRRSAQSRAIKTISPYEVEEWCADYGGRWSDPDTREWWRDRSGRPTTRISRGFVAADKSVYFVTSKQKAAHRRLYSVRHLNRDGNIETVEFEEYEREDEALFVAKCCADTFITRQWGTVGND